MSIAELFAAGQYAEVIKSVESQAGMVDINVVLAYSQALEHTGNVQGSFDVLRSLHDANPCEDVAKLIVGAMCRLSIRDPECLARLTALYPESGVVKAATGEMALQDGDLATGFDLCPNRWAVTTSTPELAGWVPWGGQPFDGKLLVSAEQGLGEEILFSCMFGEIPQAIVSCDPRLIPLFARSFPQHRFVPKGTLAEHATPDCQAISAMELGGFYRREAFQNPVSWLVADPQRALDITGAIRECAPGKRTVGVSWFSQRHKIGDSKSIPAADLFPLLGSGDVFFDLQYGEHQADLAAIRAAGHELFGITGLDVTHDIDGLAALISALDVVVTCSNTTAHLAGALGKRTILLAPGGRFVLWYWGKEGDRTPWYPSMEILRGPPRKGWAELAREVTARLSDVEHHPV